MYPVVAGSKKTAFRQFNFLIPFHRQSAVSLKILTRLMHTLYSMTNMTMTGTSIRLIDSKGNMR